MPDQPKPAPVQLDPSEVTTIDAPNYYASGIQVTFIGNDAVIIFSKPRLGVLNANPTQVAGAGNPVAVISLSAQTLKDLRAAISNQLDVFEKAFGEVKTAFLRDNPSFK